MYVSRVSRRLTAIGFSAVLAAGLAACSSTEARPAASSSGIGGMSMPAATDSSVSASPTGMAGMGSSDPRYSGTGLSASDGGFTFAPAVSTTLAAGRAVSLRYKILRVSGAAVTSFVPDQTKLMHFYLIRSDLGGFQHVHPVMAADGTWTADLAALSPGDYRAYAAFDAKNAAGTTVAEVLSRTLTVPGSVALAALPPASTTTTVDGYTLTVSGELMAGMSHELKVSISKGGVPVTNLQPYLQTYAHLTAIHAGDLAFAHLHPEGSPATTDTGGPNLTISTMLPEGGNWRFFIQFQTDGVLHTAAITLHAS